MKTISNTIINKYEIKKSVFISKIIKINSLEQIDIELKNIRKEYKDASHYCYAYIIDDKRKSSDDNEPGGTAGVPIMETLLNSDLNYVLCIVVRYFGGIKLGTGGLSRAYKKVVNDSIKNTTLVTLIDGYIIEIITDYDKQKDIDYLLKNIEYKKEYDNSIKYIIKSTKEFITILESNNINYKILEETKIELNN